MSKTFVLDTNVLLHNPRALFVFQDNELVIPLAVIEEIDNQKQRQDVRQAGHDCGRFRTCRVTSIVPQAGGTSALSRHELNR